MLGAGSGHQICEPEGDAGAGTDRGGARKTAGDSLRQWARTNFAAFSSVVHRAEDCFAAHSAGAADAERARGKFSREVARRVLECELVRELVGRAAEARRVAGGVQRAAAAQFPGE